MDSGAVGHVMHEGIVTTPDSGAKHHQRDFRMVDKSETWVKILFHSKQTREFKDA